MIDIQTVFICIIHTTLFYAIAYIVFWLSQTTYKGFGCWTVGTVTNCCLYGVVLLRLLPNEWSAIASVAGMALFLPLSAILRADALLQFTQNRAIPRYVYLLPLIIIPTNIYLYTIDNIALRCIILILAVVPFTYISCRSLFLFKPQTNRLLYLCGGTLFLMRVVGLVFQAIMLFFNKQTATVFNSPDMGAYLLFILVAEAGIGLLFFMIHTQRSHEDLIKTNAQLKNALKKGHTA